MKRQQLYSAANLLFATLAFHYRDLKLFYQYSVVLISCTAIKNDNFDSKNNYVTDEREVNVSFSLKYQV